MSTAELVRPIVASDNELGQSAVPLTRRERVVLSNLSEEVTLEQIAAKLFVTRNTVKSQVRSLYRKIGVSTRAEAVAWAESAGLR
jgi:DNA-binding CsgD family transcriptional regulator